MAFTNFTIVPWRLLNRWLNCMALFKEMKFKVSHIYGEGNRCADLLAA